MLSDGDGCNLMIVASSKKIKICGVFENERLSSYKARCISEGVMQ